MNKQEQALADKVYGAIQYASNYSARSEQGKRFQVGVSDLGFCSERTRRMLTQEVPEDTDVTKAWIGTALGDAAEQAMANAYPDAIVQAEVTITLKGETAEYVLPGHLDMILDNVLTDFKTVFGLDNIRRTGPSQQQQFQRHCYAKAAHEQGLFGDIPLSDVMVANVWIDRGGIDATPHVHMEPYDESWVTRAGEWLDEVVYAYLHEQEARKEPPREMCAKACGFYATCRALDTDIEGLLTDVEVLTGIDLMIEGRDLARQAKRLQDQAKAVLNGVNGVGNGHIVRTTHVNATAVDAFVKRGYDKVEVRPLPKGK